MEVSNDLTFDMSHMTPDAGAWYETWAVKLRTHYFLFNFYIKTFVRKVFKRVFSFLKSWI